MYISAESSAVQTLPPEHGQSRNQCLTCWVTWERMKAAAIIGGASLRPINGRSVKEKLSMQQIAMREKILNRAIDGDGRDGCVGMGRFDDGSIDHSERYMLVFWMRCNVVIGVEKNVWHGAAVSSARMSGELLCRPEKFLPRNSVNDSNYLREFLARGIFPYEKCSSDRIGQGHVSVSRQKERK